MPIKKVLSSARVPVKIWTDTVEAAAEQQLLNLAALPFVYKHVAAMPDVHLGKGATVGSVIATKGAVVPAAVGVDIGCGMMAVKVPLKIDQVMDKLATIRHSIERSVPTGFNSNNVIRDSVGDWVAANPPPSAWMLNAKVVSQIGTLGGGNHFIEICRDQNDDVWVMLHSGSRNVGKTAAEKHISNAQSIMARYFIDLKDRDLAYLVQGTADFDAYMKDLEWCQAYALQNRVEMMNRVLRELSYYTNNNEPLARLMEINCHHNYTSRENHYGENLIITRKGAVRARVDDLGIIPGSMGTGSFIVRGLGNVESFNSCSHGAGRSMSRTQARKQFTLDDLAKQTEGVECRKDDAVLDEIPSSYKDIKTVMENQNDLVEILYSLKQVLCIKGG